MRPGRRWGAAGIALVATALAGTVSLSMGRRFYPGAPYHFDSAHHLWTSLTLASQARERPVLEVATGRLRVHDALSQVLRLLLVPASLEQRFGHLWVALPCLFLYVYLFAGYVTSRSATAATAMAAAGLLFAFPLLWDPRWGLADDMPDNVATWLLGASVLAFLRSRWLTDRGWALGVGMLLGLLLLVRTVVGVFACAILLPPALLAGLRPDPALAPRPWARLLAVAGPVLVASAAIVALQGSNLYSHYWIGGHAYAAASTTMRTLAPLAAAELGWGPLAVLAAALLMSGLGAPAAERRDDVWVATWALLALPLVIVGGGLLYTSFATLWTVLWVTWLATLVPSQTFPAGSPRGLLATLLVTAAAAAIAARNSSLALAGPLDPKQQRQLFTDVADVLAREPGPNRMKVLVDEVDELFLCQARLDHGLKSILKGRGLMSVHDTFYRAHFGDLPIEAIVSLDLRYLATGGSSHLGTAQPGTWARPWLLAYCSEEGVDRNRALFAPWGQKIAQPVARALHQGLAEDSRWQRVRRWQHPFYGCVDLLRYEGSPQSMPSVGGR